MHTPPHQIPKRKVSKPPQENCQEKALKITKKGKREKHNQALRNHAESSIHTMKVHPRLLTDETRIHLRSASVRTYTFFTTGIP
jgi:hypothetical protein